MIFIVSHSPSLSVHYSKVGALDIVYGKGAYLYDEKDQPYLDCINNVTQGTYGSITSFMLTYVPNHTVGHCHARIVKAFASQVSTLSCDHYTNSDLREKYTTHLLSHFPKSFGYVFYTNSG